MASTYFWFIQDWIDGMIKAGVKISLSNLISYEPSQILDTEVEMVFENERWIIKWSKNLLPTDPKPWSDETGTRYKTKEGTELPNSKWVWIGDWTIDMENNIKDKNKGEADKDGWRYTFDFGSEWKASIAWNANTRRRIWIRTRKIQDSEMFYKKISLIDRHLLKIEEIVQGGGESNKAIMRSEKTKLLLLAELKNVEQHLFNLADKVNTQKGLPEKDLIRYRRILGEREQQFKRCQDSIRKEELEFENEMAAARKAKNQRNQAGERVWGKVDELIGENKNLLQVQKQLTEVQDHTLDDLLKVVERQKQIGIAIGAELDLHNSLLDEVDQKVDHVQKKLNKSTKQVQSILDS